MDETGVLSYILIPHDQLIRISIAIGNAAWQGTNCLGSWIFSSSCPHQRYWGSNMVNVYQRRNSGVGIRDFKSYFILYCHNRLSLTLNCAPLSQPYDVPASDRAQSSVVVVLGSVWWMCCAVRKLPLGCVCFWPCWDEGDQGALDVPWRPGGSGCALETRGLWMWPGGSGCALETRGQCLSAVKEKQPFVCKCQVTRSIHRGVAIHVIFWVSCYQPLSISLLNFSLYRKSVV